MSMERKLLRRVGFAVLATYLVLTFTFGFVAFTPDPNEALVIQQTVATGGDGSDIEQAVSSYRAARNQHVPLHQRYLGYVVATATLDWGMSFSKGAPVRQLIAAKLPYTLAYVVPALLLAFLGSIGAGLYSSVNRRSFGDRFLRGFGYFGLGTPVFWLGTVVLTTVGVAYGLTFDITEPFGGGPEVFVLPVLVLGASLLAGQLRYARAETLEYVGTDFVKLVRAKGAGKWRVGRHILRNASLPLLSLFFADMLTVLVVNIYVIESVFSIPGIGKLTLLAVRQRDMPLIVGTTMTVVFIGIVGNLIQDVAYTVLDPRVDYDD